MNKKDKIREAFIEFVLINGEKPASVFAFTKKIKITEAAFYNEYNSFLQIENDIWKSFIAETIISTEAEEIYGTYSVREKFLAFNYTLIETLKKHRSFVLTSFENMGKPVYTKRNAHFTDAKFLFKGFANELLKEGRETREVEQRPIPQLMQTYPDLLWKQTVFIIDFWVNDVSQSFETTDTLIEKSVNTSMDLLGRTPLDSMLDLGKFLYQNRKS